MCVASWGALLAVMGSQRIQRGSQVVLVVLLTEVCVFVFLNLFIFFFFWQISLEVDGGL